MSRTLVTGSTSHKAVTSDVSRILWLYYNDTARRIERLKVHQTDVQTVLFLFCFFNEVCFVCAYLAAFEKTPIHSSVLIKALAQFVPFYKIASFLPGPIAAVIAWLGGVSWAQLIWALTLPICAGKQVISVVQFWKASKIVSWPLQLDI